MEESGVGEIVAKQVDVKVQEMQKSDGIGFFEKYLSAWVLFCMVIGGLIGAYRTEVPRALSQVQFNEINAIAAVFLWLMILPMLVQIDFTSLKQVGKNPGAICLTTVINYLVKPFTMYAFAILFFRVFYVHTIPDTKLRDSYIAGLILLAGAPCTAMVFVWSTLVNGDGAYTLIQVAFNDVLMLGIYVPTVSLLIGVSNIPLPWLTIIYAILLFIVAPMALAVTIRLIVLKYYDLEYLNILVERFKPITVICLLLTLILTFIFQGEKISQKPLDIVLIAIPITIQCILNFFIAYSLGYSLCIPHSRLAPASMIATSNFFELAVAVAMSVYGLDSGAALATVVGVLVEVPVMLLLVRLCEYLRPALDKRVGICDQVCAHYSLKKC